MFIILQCCKAPEEVKPVDIIPARSCLDLLKKGVKTSGQRTRTSCLHYHLLVRTKEQLRCEIINYRQTHQLMKKHPLTGTSTECRYHR